MFLKNSERNDLKITMIYYIKSVRIKMRLNWSFRRNLEDLLEEVVEMDRLSNEHSGLWFACYE